MDLKLLDGRNHGFKNLVATSLRQFLLGSCKEWSGPAK